MKGIRDKERERDRKEGEGDLHRVGKEGERERE